MKAIILAAGSGVRMGALTRDKPKCMLKFLGKTLLKRQLDLFHDAQIKDPIVVTGYMADKVSCQGCVKIVNENYNKTNMVESLFCSKERWDDDLIISYGDIIYEKRVLQQLMNSSEDINVVVDLNGVEYFRSRFGEQFLTETESLVVDERGFITDIGEPNPHISRVRGQYIGLMKFSRKSLNILLDVYKKDKKEYWNKPWLRSKNFQNGYMTDMLQRLIDLGNKVYAVGIHGGWLEFDSETDYERYLQWKREDKLNRYYSEKKGE